MFAKFSVKKPFTVIVAVVIVIMLGVVSFGNLTPDLLPEMELPYVIVVTVYPGASPAIIEDEVTKPLEQSFSSLEGLDTVSSSSGNNSSMITLTFGASANMDIVTSNIREKISLVSGAWPQLVMTPMILKINPDIIPTTVTAVWCENMSIQELSAFVSGSLMPHLEGIDGVGSVTTSGIIEQTVSITLVEQKLADANAKLAASINEQFDTIEQGIASAISAARSSISVIGDTQSELIALARQLEGLVDNGEQSEGFDPAAAIAVLALQRANLVAQRDELNALFTRYNAFTTAREALIVREMAADETLTREQALAGLADDPEFLAQEGELAAINAELAEYGITAEQIETTLAQVDSNIVAIDESIDRLENYENMTPAEREELESALAATAQTLMKGTAVSLAATSALLSTTITQLEGTAATLDKTREDTLAQSDLSRILTVDTLGTLLAAQNFAMPAGYVSDNGASVLVSVGDRLAGLDELLDLTLFDVGVEGVAPIKLADVADMKLSDNSESIYARIDGVSGILLSFQKQSGYGTAQVSGSINAKYAELEGMYADQGLKFTNLMDQGDYINIVVDSVLENLLVGAALAIIILLLFLWDLRPTLITAISIPISVTFALVLMYFSGVTLNVISLSGLAVAVGMLVDNSVVVIENIYRLRRLGVSKNKAAVSGAVQVAGAVTSSTLTTVCVFFPIVFVEGMTRQLFVDMALTIAYSLLASLLVALTVVPAAASFMLGKTASRENKVFARVTSAYGKSLRFVLKHRLPALVLTVVLLVGSGWWSVSKGFEYMPKMDGSEIMINLEMPEGYTLPQTIEQCESYVKRLNEVEGVESVGAMQSSGMASVIGLSDAALAGSNQVTMYALLSPDTKRSNEDISRDMELIAEDYEFTADVTGTSALFAFSFGSGGGIGLKIYGNDLDDLQTAAHEVSAIIAGVDGVGEVNDGLGQTTPEFKITIDKQKAALKGLTVAQVYLDISKLLQASNSATDINLSGHSANIVVFSGKTAALTLEDLRAYEMYIENYAGETVEVKLSDIASFSTGETLASIGRESGRRLLSLSAETEEGRNVTLVTADVKKALADYTPPVGVDLVFSGENETITTALIELFKMLGIGIAIVYLIMVAQFQSFVAPFIVMFTVPLAFTGGFIGLLVSGMNISIVAVIGFITLLGVVVNNGIVLVDYANILRREQNAELFEAVVEAGETRLRPVLMTALTTILGLLPLALGVGMGAELVQPVAVVCMGGLTYATLMTMYIIPIMYTLLSKRKLRVVSEDELSVTDE